MPPAPDAEEPVWNASCCQLIPEVLREHRNTVEWGREVANNPNFYRWRVAAGSVPTPPLLSGTLAFNSHTSVDLGARRAAIQFAPRALGFYVLAAFTFLNAAFYRDFAHLHLALGQTRVYITELVLCILLVLAVLGSGRGSQRHLTLGPASVPVFSYLIWGGVCLVRGHGDGMRSLRDAAVNYYALFYIFVWIFASDRRRLQSLVAALALGTVVGVAMVFTRMATGVASITSTGTERYGNAIAVGAAMVLYYSLAKPSQTILTRAIAALGAGILSFVIVVGTQHRSAALALLVSGALWILYGQRHRALGAVGSPRGLLVVLALALGFFVVGPGAVAETAFRIESIFAGHAEFNAGWRLVLWGLLLQRVPGAMLAGAGFGDNLPVFAYRGVLYGLDPFVGTGVHNSFLFVLYKEGLIGLGLLVVSLAAVVWVVVSSRGLARGAELDWLAAAAVCALAFAAVFASFNVVLEGPYMGSFFWMFAGVAECAALSMRAVAPRTSPPAPSRSVGSQVAAVRQG